MRSSSRTPAVVVILRGVMVASPTLVWRVLAAHQVTGDADDTTGRHRTVLLASTPSILAWAMFWYW